jgi:DNA-binding MarR family transcriptional regulator
MKTDSYEYVQNIIKVVHRLKVHLDNVLAPYGITGQQARVLELIYAHSQNTQVVCHKDIEEMLGLRASSVSSLIQGLEKRGLILRRSGSDARRKQLELTEKGALLHTEMWTVFTQAQDSIVRAMSEEEKKTFLSLLKRAVDNFE